MSSKSLALTAYAELHCLSNFTFLRGASFPEELVARAHELGYQALAVTDECSLAGVVRAHMAAREIAEKVKTARTAEAKEAREAGKAEGRRENYGQAIRLIIGSEFRLTDGCHLVLLARNRKGYGELSHLITCARRRAIKGSYVIDRALVEANRPEDCLALWLPDSAQLREDIHSQALWLRDLFAGRIWLAVELLLRGDDRRKLQWLRDLGGRFTIPLCAAGGVHMHVAARRAVQDTLTAVRLGRPLAELGLAAEPNGQRHLRDRRQLAKLYPPALLMATVEIASRCRFSLDELRYEYPAELVPPDYSADAWLRRLTEQGIKRRWPGGICGKNRQAVEHELALIRKLRYAHFFLTVHDIVEFARWENILCQGRGSAANSVVCYCLGITEVDPDKTRLLFERFISAERDEPPDVDVDFEHACREEVIQYLYDKYGRGRTAIAATVITYRSRSAIRDVGKALGLKPELIDHLAKSIFWWGSDIKEQLADARVDHNDPVIRRLLHLARTITGFPRHLSQHVGGFIISEGPLSHLVPIENAAMAGRSIIQWDKDDLESLGLLKVDVLALGMLTALHKALDLVSSYSEQALTMAGVPREDEAVYDMICAADTVGVFQIESRAQMSMLPRLRPRCYYDLVIQIAIVRPGPIEGGMVHPYLDRRGNPKAVHYESEAIRGVLERTLGVPIFQEQVMQLAIVGAGFTPGEADQLRRAMAAWKKKGGLEPFKDKLIGGFLGNGYSEDFARRVYRQIKGFGEYGFPESHSASFALLAYVSSWFKLYHPAAFCCALLNSQPMGFYAPAQLIRDARRHGVPVAPVDVNASDYDCTLELPPGFRKPARHDRITRGPVLRTGLRLVKGLSKSGACALVAARGDNLYQTVQDLVFRSGIGKKDLEALAAADALRGLAGDRHRAFWLAAGVEVPRGRNKSQAAGQSMGAGPAGLYPGLSNSRQLDFQPDPSIAGCAGSDFGVDVMLPVPTERQNIAGDYNSTGFTLRRHPLALYRRHLSRYGVVPAGRLPDIGNETTVKVTGLVTARQRPQTASGVTFITVEDETGFVNVVVWPKLGEEKRPIVRRAMLLGVVGHLQKSGEVIHLIAHDLVDLSHWVKDMQTRSRDFT